jgi:hypothetical protein
LFRSITKALQEKIDQIAEMAEVMRQAINLDEKTSNEYEERIKLLETENAGLKELLKIKSTYEINNTE